MEVSRRLFYNSSEAVLKNLGGNLETKFSAGSKISKSLNIFYKTELIEHIRGRARGISVFVLADMWAQPMIKLDRRVQSTTCVCV